MTTVLLAVHCNTLFFSVAAARGWFRPIILNGRKVFLERRMLWIGNTLCLITAAGITAGQSLARDRILRRALVADFLMLSFGFAEDVVDTYEAGAFPYESLRKLPCAWPHCC